MRQTIETVYNFYFNDIYRFLLSLCRSHYTAEDLVQETFLRAYLHVDIDSDENVKSWLFTVAHNVFIDHYRKQTRMEIKGRGFFSRLFDKEKGPEETIIIDEGIQEVINQLKGLTKTQKTAVLLYDFHELTYIEAATVMNMTLANYKVTLFRGRQAIRQKRGSAKDE